MLSTEELFPSVVAEGTRRRRRRRARVLASTVVVVVVGAGITALHSQRPARRMTVSAAGPSLPTTLVPSVGGREVRVNSPLPPLPAEASVWSDVGPDIALVQRLASALGVGGRAVATAEGFAVEGGNAVLRVTSVNGKPGWQLQMGECPVGLCRPPNVRPTVAPPPTVETRDAPDHPPLATASIAGDAARRIATVLGGVAVPELQMSLNEWWAGFEFMGGDVVLGGSGFRAHIQTDGSVRLAEGLIDRPGEPVVPVRLVGIDEGLRRLAAPAAASLGGVLCRPDPCDEQPLVVTGAHLGWKLETEGFVPVYVFTLEDGSERPVDAI